MNKLLYILLLVSFSVFGQLTTNTTLTPEQLVQDILVGTGVTVSNITFQKASVQATSMGQFNGVNSNIGINQGIILSTGSVLDGTQNLSGNVVKTGPVGPNNNSAAGKNWFGTGDPDLTSLVSIPTFDAVVLEFDFIPQGDTVEFNYVFASEEYPEFVFGGFNDVFAFFISGPGITGEQNLAIIPGTTSEVSINTINDVVNSSLYVSNGDGQELPQSNDATVVNFDGFTVPLKAVSKVTPCQTYHLKIALADVGDGSYDSGVFLQGGSLSSNPRFEVAQRALVDIGTDNLLAEGCADGLLELQRTEDLWASFSVDYRILGTATNGTDYQVLNGSVTFAPNSNTASINIVPFLDGLTETDETVILRFPNPDICVNDSFDYVFTITEASPVVTEDDTTNIVCPSDAAAIDVKFSGGFGPYNFNWDNASETSATINVTPNNSTNYRFTVSDVCGSSSSSEHTVIVPALGPLSVVTTNDTSILCAGTEVELLATATGGAGNYSFLWNTGSTTAKIEPTITADAIFDVVVNDLCGNSATSSVNVNLTSLPFTLDVFSDTTVCEGEQVNLEVVPNGGIPPYSIFWENGDLTTTTTTTVNTTSFFSVIVRDSCGIIPVRDSAKITIQKPDAQFFINSTRLETNQEIIFISNSVGNISSYNWDLGNGDQSDEQSPKKVFTKDSTYQIVLEVTDELGCTDITSQLISITPPLYFYMPNSFTPNEDARNDTFGPVGEGISVYELVIFNRWGEIVFQTKSFSEHWDGLGPLGDPLPGGVYVYKVDLIANNGESINRLGHVTLIR